MSDLLKMGGLWSNKDKNGNEYFDLQKHVQRERKPARFSILLVSKTEKR